MSNQELWSTPSGTIVVSLWFHNAFEYQLISAVYSLCRRVDYTIIRNICVSETRASSTAE